MGREGGEKNRVKRMKRDCSQAGKEEKRQEKEEIKKAG